MPLRKGFLLAMLVTMVVVAALGRVSFKANPDALKPAAWLRAPAATATALLGYGSLPANESGRWLRSSGWKSELPPASLVPIQFKNATNLGAGSLLVASRGLTDPDFAKTVVLLVHYDEKGVLGLVLNRRTDMPLSRVLDLKAAKGLSDPVYLGGPVETSAVLALAQSPAKLEKAEHLFAGVYLITDKGLLEQTLSAKPDPGDFHVYLGYAGWTQDQLRAEIQSGAWFVFPADAGAVFSSDPDALWLKMIKKTELHWARTGPPAGSLQPAEIFWQLPRD